MMTTTASGLQYEDTVVGGGATAQAGQHVSVHYTGWLYNNGVKGAKFDSSKDRNDPFEFGLGAGMRFLLARFSQFNRGPYTSDLWMFLKPRTH